MYELWIRPRTDSLVHIKGTLGKNFRLDRLRRVRENALKNVDGWRDERERVVARAKARHDASFSRRGAQTRVGGTGDRGWVARE